MLTTIFNENSAPRSCYFPHSDANLPQRVVLGWQRAERPSYSWRGLERPDGPIGIFQYTLAGRGVLERQGVQYTLEPGQAFLVEVPDDHHYYLPAGWTPWEFLFICFNGGDQLRHLRWVLERHDPVFTLEQTHPALNALATLSTAIGEHRVPDAETLAAHLYGFMMALRRLVPNPQSAPHPAIVRAMQHAAQHYPADIGIDDLAVAAGLSRAHFCRLFRRELDRSPLEYLQSIRLERACTLLRGTRLSLEEIAEQCGFASASYLGKVFRKSHHITPVAYRHGEEPTACSEPPVTVPVSRPAYVDPCTEMYR